MGSVVATVTVAATAAAAAATAASSASSNAYVTDAEAAVDAAVKASGSGISTSLVVVAADAYEAGSAVYAFADALGAPPRLRPTPHALTHGRAKVALLPVDPLLRDAAHDVRLVGGLDAVGGLHLEEALLHHHHVAAREDHPPRALDHPRRPCLDAPPLLGAD